MPAFAPEGQPSPSPVGNAMTDFLANLGQTAMNDLMTPLPSAWSTLENQTDARALQIERYRKTGDPSVMKDPVPEAFANPIIAGFGDSPLMTRGYHGTPHTFEPVEHNPFGEFKDEAIGSGEGAQAYGYGHYVAGNPGVASQYQRNLTDFQVHYKGQPVNNTSPVVKQALNALLDTRGDIEGALNNLKGSPEVHDWLRDFGPELTVRGSPGHLLEVAIRPDEEELLDWDKPLSQQSPAVQSALKNMPQAAWERDQDVEGGKFYHKLSARMASRSQAESGGYDPAAFDDRHRAASAALAQAGIPGIRYLDAGSRAKVGMSNDIRLTNIGDGEYELRAYNKESGQKFTTDSLHDRLNEQQVRGLVGDKVADDLLAQLKAKSTQPFGAKAYHSGPVEFKGSHNYVIFSPSDLAITARSGQRLYPIEHNPFTQQASPVDHDPFAAKEPD